MALVLGVDPGINGGLAIVGLGGVSPTYVRPTLLAVGDIPTTGDKAKRRVAVAATLEWIRKFPPDHARIIHSSNACLRTGTYYRSYCGRCLNLMPIPDPQCFINNFKLPKSSSACNF